MRDKPRIGVSACLLGQSVRWDAGHKRDACLVEVLGRRVEWVLVCPEVEAGFPIPRETMQLVRTKGRGIRLKTTKTERDMTGRMTRYVKKRVEELARARLSGYVLKKDSPSCGMERVKVFAEAGRAARTGRGLFAVALMARLPGLPVEEGERLSDSRVRENFIERVFAYQRVRALTVVATPEARGRRRR
jgi:uncharacterized protein YbbK (DUF523 family)